MSLVSGIMSKKFKNFIASLGKMPQTDLNKAVNAFANEMENEVYQAIRSADLIIPPGALVITTPTGPATNVQPIILKSPLK